jgi:integrase
VNVRANVSTTEEPDAGKPHVRDCGGGSGQPESLRRSACKISKTRSEQEGRYLLGNAMARSVIDGQRGNGSDHVFPGPSGDRMARMNNTRLRNARKAAKLPVRWRDLRHTFGERAGAAGVPWKYRKVLPGHALRDIIGHYSVPGPHAHWRKPKSAPARAP